MKEWINRCHFGDVRAVLRKMIEAGVQVDCIVTSPPYWGLRSYLPAEHPDKVHELGSEPTIGEFIASMTEVFDLCRQVLRKDGTCWINMGDSYASKPNGPHGVPKPGSIAPHVATRTAHARRSSHVPEGFKHKDLIGQPWRLAFALQDAGWWLRQDNVWHKPNPMPESVTDRFTKAHEYVFMLTKSARYYFDQEAVLEPVSPNTHARLSQNVLAQIGSERANGGAKTNGNMKAVGRRAVPPGSPDDAGSAVPRGVGWGHGTDADDRQRGRVTARKETAEDNDSAYGDGKSERMGRGAGWRDRKLADGEDATKNNASFNSAMAVMPSMRNKRSVWIIPTESYKGAHFATYPRALVEPCILAGCRPGGVVLDPFFGSGTTGQVAQQLGRQFIGIELNAANDPLQTERLRQPSLMLGVA